MCKSSPSRKCLHCGTEFEPYRPNSHYCSKQCWKVGTNFFAENYFKKKHGITLAERDAIFADQDGNCAICEEAMTLVAKKPNSAHLDHCHTTEERHALLCARCNQAAGLLGENPAITAKLTAYLLDTAKVPTR